MPRSPNAKRAELERRGVKTEPYDRALARTRRHERFDKIVGGAIPLFGMLGPIALLFGAGYLSDPRVVAWLDAISPGLAAKIAPIAMTMVFMSGGVLTIGVFALLGFMNWRARRLEAHTERVYAEVLRGAPEAGGLRAVEARGRGGLSETRPSE